MKGKYNKLFIIGNGFDRWQNLETSYDNFREYYRINIGKVTKGLHIKTKINQDGLLITPVEMIFGDIFKPKFLPNEFFWNLESSMALIDDQYISSYFEKTNKGVRQLKETISQALEIISKIFSDWITHMTIDPTDSGYTFTEDSYFINFNYTDTLEKRFHVNEINDYHIHGYASDPESIIVGHSTHPETPFEELMEQKFIYCPNGKKSIRLQELYMIEDALFETDKAVQDNIDDLCEDMILSDLHIEEIKDIYVLGHSFAETDYEYFEFLVKATQKGCDFNELSSIYQSQKLLSELTEDNMLEFIFLNIFYATIHRKRVFGKENISFPREEAIERSIFGKNNVVVDQFGKVYAEDEVINEAEAAVHKRFMLEQSLRTKQIIGEIRILNNVQELPSDCLSLLKIANYIDGGHIPRIHDAKWHISYYSEEDRKRIEEVMKKTGCNNYVLYNNIDECIKKFKD